jgi:cytochrome c556
MKTLALVFLAGATALAQAQTPAAPRQAATGRPPTRNVGSMSDLMVKIIYPASDALFYIESRTPKTDAEWTTLEGQALMVAESANLLMLPGRARDQKQWMADSKLMLEAGAAAVKAAKAKDVAGIVALSDQLMESCTSCHKNYRPGYGKPVPQVR